jgi:hypothetical protein
LEILDRLLKLQEQKSPQLPKEHVFPIPEGASILGEVPEILRSLYVAMADLADECNEFNIADKSEASEEERKQLVGEAGKKSIIFKALKEVFWCEIRLRFNLLHEEGQVGVSDNWQLWHVAKPECDCLACQMARLIGAKGPSIIYMR